MVDICTKIAAIIEDDYCASTVGEQISMIDGDEIQEIFHKAGGKRTWKGMVEFVIGAPHKQTAPLSAALVPQS